MLKRKTEELKCGMKEIKISNNSYKEKFVCVITQFHDKAYTSFYELLTSYSRMQCEFQEFVNFFRDDYTKITTEDFFGSFAIFLQHLATTKDFLLQKERESEGDSQTLADNQKLSEQYFNNLPTKIKLDHNIETKMSTNLINDEENVEFAYLKEIKTNRMSVVKRAAKADLDTFSNYKNEICDNYEMVYTKRKSVPKKPQRLSEKNLEIKEKRNILANDINFSEENRDLECDEHSIDDAAKMSSVPLDGSFSKGKMKQIPFMKTSEWPHNNINEPHYNADKTKTETVENVLSRDGVMSNNGDYLCREPIINKSMINDTTTFQTESSDCSSGFCIKKTNTFSPLPWVSPFNSPVQQRKPYRSGEEMLNSIGISKLSNIKSTADDLTKSLINNRIKNEPQTNVQPIQETLLQETLLQLQDNELHCINNSQVFHTLYENGNFEVEYDNDNKSGLNKYLDRVDNFDCNNNFSENNEIPVNKNTETSLNKDLKSSEHEETNDSRQNQTNAVFIDLMKAKLNADRQRPVFKRKITDHEEPLYASVIKESLQEYERQRTSSIITGNENLSEKFTPIDFMSILQKKFVEANPNINDYTQDNPSQLAVAYEPIYAEVIEKTLIDYENERNEHERVRKLGLASQSKFIYDDTTERSSPNFFGILEDNMIENKLLFTDDCDLYNQKDEPSCALVIKAALKWYRKTVIHQKTNNVRVGQGSSLSRSPSDASSTSEEVRVINTSIMDSSPQIYLVSSKQVIPKIPSPDYTCSTFHVNDVFLTKDEDVENKIESCVETSNINYESFFSLEEKANPVESHPYHIDRPFWNETENSDSLKSNNIKRSSLKKTTSDIKPNSVSFFKNVEVINENDELNQKDVFRQEEPLKGSPQIDKKNEKRKKTPYSDVSPIDRIFYEADLEIHKKKQSVDNFQTNNDHTQRIDTPSKLSSVKLPNSEALPVAPPPVTANLIQNKPIILNLPDNAGVMQSVELTEEDLQDIAKEHNISLEELKEGGFIYNLLFDLITTTYPNGKVTTKLVPQGQGQKFVNDILLKEKSRGAKFPVLPSTPPPLVNRSTKPKNVSRSPIIPANNIDFDIRHGNENLIRTIIPSPDYLNEFSTDTANTIDIIPPPDYLNEFSTDTANTIDITSSDLQEGIEKKLTQQTYDENFLKEVNKSLANSFIQPLTKSTSKKPLKNNIPLPIEKNLMKLSIEYENPKYSSDEPQYTSIIKKEPIALDITDQSTNQSMITTDQSVSLYVDQSNDQVKLDKVFKTIGRNDPNPDYKPDYDEDYSNVHPPQLPDRSTKPAKKPCLLVTQIPLPPLSTMPHSPKCKDQLIIAKFSPVLR